MYFSLEISIVLTIIAAAMWGSWMQIVKHLKGYPIEGVVFWLYAFSFVLVWTVTCAAAPFLLEDGVFSLIVKHRAVTGKILFAGGMMSLGLFCSLVIIKSVGLILSTTISGGVGTLLGLATSLMEEGMPEGEHVAILLALTTIVFITAGFLSAYASKCRDADRGRKEKTQAVSLKVILLMLLSAILTNGWSIGTAAGTAASLPPILTCACMATGSFLSVLIICAVVFTKKRQWKQVLCIGSTKKPLMLCAVSAFCHYGGNMISIYSMPAISATISFLLGKSSNLWTIFWGMAFGEFSGVSRKTKFVLGTSIVLFLAGIALLTIYKFG